MADQYPSEQQVLGWMSSLSNWGRWGEDDQRGCLNLVTPSKAKQAAGLVQDGVSVSCARPILTEMAADTTFQVQRYMVDSGEGRDTDPPERTLTRRGAAEFIGMVFHGQTITHIDALSHYSWQGKLYNGKPANLVTSREGAQTHSIEPAGDGIVTRGVLLDIAALRNVDWLPPNQPVMPQDLEDAEARQGVRVEEGDILLVRTGNYRKRLDDRTSAQHRADGCLPGGLYALVQGPGSGHAGNGHVQRRAPKPVRNHRQPAAHCVPGDPGPLAHRQCQPRGVSRGLPRTQPARIHADPGTTEAKKRDRLSGEPDSRFLGRAPI